MSGSLNFINNFRGSTNSIDEDGFLTSQNRPKSLKLWRSSSSINLIGHSNKNKSPIYESIPLAATFSKYGSTESLNTLSNYKNKNLHWSFKEFESVLNSWDTIVTIVLVAAKGLPPSPNDGAAHELYCKFRLGSESFKSKSVSHTQQPEWRERFKLHLFKDHLLKLSLWDKGRQKNFMGSCVLDLSTLEKERTHEIWQELDDGYGYIHLSVTMCVIRLVPSLQSADIKIDDVQQKHSNLDLNSDWRLVGSLHVKVIRAKGLSGKSSAYCTLELDNERLQTHRASHSPEPMWNKSYIMNVYDVTSVLDVKIHGSSLTNTLLNEFMGQVSIPLLWIKNGETRWYALKSRNKRSSARGNCPRILLQMTVKWNPIKAAFRLFRPKEVKYIEKPNRLDIPLIFKNLVIFADIFNTHLDMNERLKRLFEWENRELSAIALLVWLFFCYHLRTWAIPLIILLPFLYFWVYTRIQDNNLCNGGEAHLGNGTNHVGKETKGKSYKINDMQDIITTVTFVLELLVSLIERMKNLLMFKVPFLSYVVMSLLGVISVVLYFIPFNYVLMAFGVYKFVRKYLNPDRILNNDLLDFISRIPDNKLLKDWKELNVPEPISVN